MRYELTHLQEAYPDPLPEIWGTVYQRLRQTGMSSHYEPWHCHDCAPHLGLNFGLADERKKTRVKEKIGMPTPRKRSIASRRER